MESAINIRKNQSSSKLFDICFKFNVSIPNPFAEIAEQLAREFLPEPQIYQILTYQESIAYFVENRPPNACKGVMLKEKTADGYIFTQFFLNQTNQFVTRPSGGIYGRRLPVIRFDRELEDCFGDKEMVIVE
jgi:hypothetical protein